MFSLFQDDLNLNASPEAAEIPPLGSLGAAAFPAEMYSSDQNDTFFDWQTSISAYPPNANLNPNNNSGNLHLSNDSFMASIGEAFNGYFAQTGGSEPATPFSPSSGQSHAQDSFTHHQGLKTQQNNISAAVHASESFENPALICGGEGQIGISMAEVLPQPKVPMKKDVASITAAILSQQEADSERAAEKKMPKKSTKGDKMLRQAKKTSKAATTKNLSNTAKKNLPNMVPTDYMNFLQVASAADIAQTTLPHAAVIHAPKQETAAPIPAKNATPCKSNDNMSSTGMLSFGSNESLHFSEPFSSSPKNHAIVSTPSEFGYEHHLQNEFDGHIDFSTKLEPQYQSMAGMTPHHFQQPVQIHQIPRQASTLAQTTTTGPTRHKREKPLSHTPRPPNSFIIYRKEKHAELMSQSTSTSTLNNNVISKIVGNMWKQETPEVKALYAAKAQEEKRVHMLKHPDYKYRPKKAPPKQGSSEHDLAAESTSVGASGSATRKGTASATQRFSRAPAEIASKPSTMGGSLHAIPPAVSAGQCGPGNSHGIGGMGMSMSTLEDLQYCQTSPTFGQEFFPMHQAMYTSGYAMGQPSFEQGMWVGGDSSEMQMPGPAFGVYWAPPTQQVMQHSSGQGFQFDQQGNNQSQ